VKNIESKINQIGDILKLYDKILLLEKRQQEAEGIFDYLLDKYRSSDYDRRTYYALKEILGTQKNINYTQRRITDVLVRYTLKDSFGQNIH
jgi:hypothetical protein